VKDALYRRTLSTGVGFFNFGGNDDIPQAAGVAPTIPVRYDVRIEAPSTIRVRNNVFPSLVASADLQLRGTFARPLLFGRFEVDRGEAQFEGKRYVLTRGTIDFNNPTRIEPFFDIEAETRVRVPGETYRVTVRAAGPQDRLDPVLTSDPPLPEVEVLALLFGNIAPGGNAELNQYSTVITPQQQLMRAQLAQQLTGGISSEVGRAVERAVGVDTFQITPLLGDPNAQTARLEPSARVTIVKNLSDRLAVTYQRSLSSSSRDQIILLEYDPTDRYSWILSRNEDGTFALDLRVRRTFR
jgi:translocation and assembly module TamB